MLWSVTRGWLTPRPPGPSKFRWSIFRKKLWFFYWVVAIAKLTNLPRSRGKHFGNGPTGWQRVQAICDFVHRHIEFGYHHARRTRTAWEAYNEGQGVCRDFAHLAIAFCRCMNIPARYCTGYLGDIRIPPIPGPMDFAGWFEAYLGDRWYTFDARNNTPRIGRVLMARGRDACDVALTSTFGPNMLERFTVWAEEVVPSQ
jgi:transglutaminase-like putative cysteine protease